MKTLGCSLILLLILSLISLFCGVADMNIRQLSAGDSAAWDIFWNTRLPRTMALLMAGTALAIAGTIMQILSRNRFVDSSTAGTVDSACLGLLCAIILAPWLPVAGKMLCAVLFAFAGTLLFMLILQRIPLRSPLVVPLTGIMLGSIIRAVTDFYAYRYDVLQSLRIWTSGDFSSVMAGRYEFLWGAAPLILLAYYTANRFTLAALGRDFTTMLGLRYRHIMLLGLMLVAAITALAVATVGQIPFLGLIVPNIIALKMGDNLRRTFPFIAIFGAALLLFCDICGRIIRFPYEIPAGTIMGVIGSALFLYLLLSDKISCKGGSPLA